MARELVFEDNFTSLNKNVWSLRGTAYTPGTMHSKASWEAVKISGGKLRLLAKPVSEGVFINGHIGTEGSVEVRKGSYVEASMRFHPYLGSHASLWLQTPLPYSVGRPEIDVCEYFGIKNPERKTPANMWNCVYYRDNDEDPLLTWRETTQDTLQTRWSKIYHTYGLLWDNTGYTFYIDKKEVGHTNVGESDIPKYLVLSMITRDYEIANYRADMVDTYKLSVDWVRVWA